MWGTTSIRTKAVVGPRTCPTAACSDGNSETPTFARFSEPLNFRLFQQYRSYAAIRGRHTLVRFCLKSRRLLAQSAAARCNVLCPSYVNPFHSLLPPTTRRSIGLIKSEPHALGARISAIVCCNVLTFDPSDTIPPSTTAIDPITAT